MKLAIVRQRYNPFGGAERFVERALPALERAGVQPVLIARSAKGWGAGRFLKVDPFFIGNLWRDLSFCHAARSAWRKEGFSFVQSHERIPGCDVYRAGDGVHRRWLELRRASAGAMERLAIALNPYHRYVCAAEKEMFEDPRLRAVICNSRMVEQDILRTFRIDGRKLRVIYNGVDLEYFHPVHRESLRPQARQRLGCGEKDFVLAFVGSGFARKGLQAAIGALALLGANYRLLVAGRDRDAERFSALAAKKGVLDRVMFLGGVDDVRPVYAAADCFILPTRYDPFPNTALEAMAMGLPVVVTPRCGAAEIVDDAVNGWVCDPDDAAGLASKVQAAASEGAAAGRAARNTAEAFGIDTMAKQLADFYGSL